VSKSKERIHYLNLGPWPGFVGFTMSDDAFQREMRRLKIANPGSSMANERSNATTHFLSNHGTSLAIICMEPMSRKRSKEQYAALLAHEATHVVQQMRDDLGELGREAEAYLVQQIVQVCLEIAWKTGRTTRRKPVQ
jgi:hypothetical protein